LPKRRHRDIVFSDLRGHAIVSVVPTMFCAPPLAWAVPSRHSAHAAGTTARKLPSTMRQLSAMPDFDFKLNVILIY
jgi:hypothetical protein